MMSNDVESSLPISIMQRMLKRHDDIRNNNPVPVDKKKNLYQCTEEQNRTEHFYHSSTI